MPSAAAEVHLFNPDPASYLPHRYPFLLLDRILELEKGIQAVARTLVTTTHGFPQILLVEAVAQLSGILTVEQEGEGGFLAAIDSAEFSNAVAVGDLLTISARVVKAFGRLFLVEGAVVCGDKPILKVQLTLGVGRL
jgi:3-hydroxyacyl-[acyl-carrier-protein] dehydratase